MTKQKINVVSFSGGRTSAYLVYLMKDKPNTKFIFMDTGAEHPKTYDFIRNVVKEFGIDLVCLRTKFNQILGQANSFTELDISEIGCDLQPWRDMLKKYGTPYNPGGAFCTDRMKLVPFTKYCNENYGKNNYKTILGIRVDEPKRLRPRDDAEYLASFSDFDKQDILDFWKSQEFDLEIPEHLGNCVFCIKKGINKIALACRDEPELASDFNKILKADSVRIVEKRKSPSLEMYRGRNTFDGVIKLFKAHSRDDILSRMRLSGQNDSGSCSESCEAILSEKEPQITDESNVPVVKQKIGDQWRTPPEVVNYIESRFGVITRDLCASDNNAVAKFHYDIYDDFLEQRVDPLEIGETGFLNPPYSNPMPFVKKAIDFMNGGMRVIMLLNMDTSTKWFELIVDSATTIMPIVGGRVAFLDGAGVAMRGNNKPQVLVEFAPFNLSSAKWDPVNIKEIYKAKK